MPGIIVLLLYLATVCLNVYALRRIDLRRLQFIDGVLIGLTYYVTIPMAVILLYGQINPEFLPIAPYLPYLDTDTTLVIYIGSATLCLLKLAMAGGITRIKFGKAKAAGNRAHDMDGTAQRARSRSGRAEPLRYLIYIAGIVLPIYFAATFYAFFVSGVSEGGHWYHATSEMMAESGSFLFIKHVSNFARTAVFAVLACIAIRSEKYKWLVISLGLVISVTELFVTFNRITVAYFALMLIVINWRRIYTALFLTFSGLYFGISISGIWPEFRGQVSNFGYSLPGIAAALSKAVEVNSVSRPFVDEMNGMFESFNFTVLNWVVKNVDQLNVDFGTYLVRPLTVIVPRSIWADRPSSFATTTGNRFSEGELAVNSLLFGEPFANSPLIWPVLMIMVVLFYDWCFRSMSNRSAVWGAVGAFIAFAWWRFDSSFPAISVLFSVVIYMALQLKSLRRPPVGALAPAGGELPGAARSR
jgi:hypothetical protein